ncbi:MAG: type II CAAX endopeptidase family protein [Bacillota bacterium]|nr:type II CAAX endopeptidase family protein [Bacillota bacterium]
MEENIIGYDNDIGKLYKKEASACAFTLLTYIILEIFFEYALSAINLLIYKGYFNINFLSYKMYNNSDWIGVLISTASVVLSFLVTFCIIYRKSFASALKEKMRYGKGLAKTVVKGVPALFFAVYIGNYVYMAILIILKYFGVSYNANAVLNPNYKGAANVIYWAYVCLAAPVIEEFIFRGFILGKMKKYGNRSAIFISAILFAMMHGILTQIPMAFMAGIVLGCVCVYTNSIFPSIIMHILFNTINMIGGTFSENVFSKVMLCLSVIGLLVIIEAARKRIWEDSVREQGKYVKWFFSRIWVLLLIAFHILIGAQYFQL